MWPGSHQAVQLFYEWSLDLSHNTTLGWTPGALSPAGFLRRDEQADGAHNCHEKFPLIHLGITELRLPCIPHAMEQADEEEDVTLTGTLWEHDLAPDLF